MIIISPDIKNTKDNLIFNIFYFIVECENFNNGNKKMIENNEKNNLKMEKQNALFFPKKLKKIESASLKTSFKDESGKFSLKNFSLKDWYQESKSNGVLDKLIWGATAVIAVIGVASYMISRNLKENIEEQKVTMGRLIGEYTLTEQNGPKPFVVSVREESTGKVFENIKIADDCRLFSQKSYVGEKMKLIKFTVVNVNNELDVSYYFKGIEDRVCEGRSFEPDASNAFYIAK